MKPVKTQKKTTLKQLEQSFSNLVYAVTILNKLYKV